MPSPGTKLRARSKRGLLLLLALLFPGLPVAPLPAHELTEGVGTQTTFLIYPDRLEMEINLGFSASAGFPVLQRLDADGDDRISPEEAQALIDERAPRLLPFLDLRVNGRAVEIEIEGGEEAGLRGTVMVKPFDIYYRATAKLPPALPTGDSYLHFTDRSFENQTSSQITWLPWDGHGEGISYVYKTPMV
ncbi:MAG: hypothetical protein ACO4CW_10810, partial [Planctomycetota bacterium]